MFNFVAVLAAVLAGVICTFVAREKGATWTRATTIGARVFWLGLCAPMVLHFYDLHAVVW
ncbi:hypothetical protein AB0I99_00620 [Streptomyces spongiicola]|uniref:hypothetical protein n=1 Tax=Streptomyces spongiicola TaxID=1690221 RepID=UPI0033C8BC34